VLYHNVRVAAHAMRFVDGMAFIAGSSAGWWVGVSAQAWSASTGPAMAWFAVAGSTLLMLLGARHHAYHARRTEEVLLEMLVLLEVTVYALGLACLITELASQGLPSGAYAAAACGAFAAIAVRHAVARLLIRVIRRRGGDNRVWLVVGSNERAIEVCREVRANRHYGIQLDSIVDLTDGSEGSPSDRARAVAQALPGLELQLLDDVEALRSLLSDRIIDEVVVTLPLRSRYNDIERILQIASVAGISVKLHSESFRVDGLATEVSRVGNVPLVTHYSGPSSYGGLLLKRGIDVAMSGIGLALLSPLFLVLAVAVRLDSPGPVFFRQLRMGLHGRQFRMIKFRSMVRDAPQLRDHMAAQNERDGVAFKVQNDMRITRVGRLLRKYHLDELPQLWNVLLGEMSIVGPRPLPVSEAKGTEWWQRRRHSMPPGLTCLWQLADDPKMPFMQWMELDMKYIDNWSVWLDIKVMFRTVGTVMRGSGW
jgi:exopolysaccharide biosynthesis polyprenyl glycosylphosphotransferase